MEELQGREARSRESSSFASQFDTSADARFLTPSPPSSPCSIMNPSAPAFMPSPTPPSDSQARELRCVNQSLCKALAEARQAQNAAQAALNVTKLALKEEAAKRAKAEEEVKSLLRANISLASTAQMLGAIVKHNITPKTTIAPSTASSPVLVQGEGRVQVSKIKNPPDVLAGTPHAIAGGGTTDSTESILYDVLEHQRAQYQQQGYLEVGPGHDRTARAPGIGLGKPQDPEMTKSLEMQKVTQDASFDEVAISVEQDTGGLAREGNSTTGSDHASRSLGDFREVTNRTITTPYQCRPKWAILQNRPLFDNDQELEQARRQNGRHQPCSTFWQHPVRYMPASDEKNLCRTLILDFLPLDTTMRDVLRLIRGGALESIQLFPPIGTVTDFMTARVVFHYEMPADDIYLHWQKYGLTVRGQQIRVLQLGYTYPKNRQLDEDVFIRCYTRILLIDNIDDQVIQHLPAFLNQQIKMGFVIEIGQADDGITMIEFTSVVEAAKAMRAMQAEEMFHGAVFDFEDDYCQEGSYLY